jgi:putative NADPH-quinone reductase
MQYNFKIIRWGSVSAILKGWFDRVLVPGFSYDVRGKIFGHSPLNNKKRKAWLVTSTGGPEVVYKP